MTETAITPVGLKRRRIEWNDAILNIVPFFLQTVPSDNGKVFNGSPDTSVSGENMEGELSITERTRMLHEKCKNPDPIDISYITKVTAEEHDNIDWLLDNLEDLQGMPEYVNKAVAVLNQAIIATDDFVDVLKRRLGPENIKKYNVYVTSISAYESEYLPSWVE